MSKEDFDREVKKEDFGCERMKIELKVRHELLDYAQLVKRWIEINGLPQ